MAGAGRKIKKLIVREKVLFLLPEIFQETPFLPGRKHGAGGFVAGPLSLQDPDASLFFVGCSGGKIQGLGPEGTGIFLPPSGPFDESRFKA